jgi:tetratricopeptide (TPR) repeat protein
VSGEIESADAVLESAEALQRSPAEDDLGFVACMRIARGCSQLLSGDLARALASLSEARSLSDRIAFATCQALSRNLLVAAHAEAGCSDSAEATARELLSLCEPSRLRLYSEHGETYLATARLDARRVPEAIKMLRPLLDGHNIYLLASARSRLSHALVAAGDLTSAEREATATLEQGAGFPSARAAALGALALVALHRGRWSDALGLAQRGLDLASRGGWLRDGSVLRLARAEALHALGRWDDARAAIREARDRIQRIAATLDQPEQRESFITNVDANARTLKLAHEWVGEETEIA